MLAQIVLVGDMAHDNMIMDVCGELHSFSSHGGDMAEEEVVRHAGLRLLAWAFQW